MCVDLSSCSVYIMGQSPLYQFVVYYFDITAEGGRIIVELHVASFFRSVGEDFYPFHSASKTDSPLGKVIAKGVIGNGHWAGCRIGNQYAHAIEDIVLNDNWDG